MAARIRLKRHGRRDQTFFRLGVFDSRTRRDGRAIEELGYYDPRVASEDKKYSLNRERIGYWLSQGARPSVTVESILLNQGIDVPGSKKQRALSPEERAEREHVREEKRLKREEALRRKSVLQATAQTPLSKREKREIRKSGG